MGFCEVADVPKGALPFLAMSVTTVNQPAYMAAPGISTALPTTTYSASPAITTTPRMGFSTPAATTTFAPSAVRSTSVVPMPVPGYAAAPALPTTTTTPPQVAPLPMATSMIATPYSQAAPPALPMATSMMATPYAQQPAMAGYDPAAYGAYGANSGYPTGYGQQYAQPGQQYAQPAQQYAEYPQGTQHPQDQYGAKYGAQYPQGTQYGTQYPQDTQYTQPTQKKKKSGCC